MASDPTTTAARLPCKPGCVLASPHERDGCQTLDELQRATAAGPWCPVCRQKVATRGVYQPPNGFYEAFAEHGCDGDGRRVNDVDHGYLIDGKVVPPWEM